MIKQQQYRCYNKFRKNLLNNQRSPEALDKRKAPEISHAFFSLDKLPSRLHHALTPRDCDLCSGSCRSRRNFEVLLRSSNSLQQLDMKEFFLNVSRYPRYLVAFTLGVMNSVAEPLAARRSNPITAVALIGALISGGISLTLVLRAMVHSAPMA